MKIISFMDCLTRFLTQNFELLTTTYNIPILNKLWYQKL